MFVFACLVAFACDRPAFEQYQAIEQGVWEKDRAYQFIFEIKDTTVAYDISLEIRNNNLYPYQNLWILSQTVFPDSTLRRDTTECMLADDYGKWYGQGISVFEISQPVQTRFHFPRSGHYTVSVRQGMRQDELPGIQGIGLRVQPSW